MKRILLDTNAYSNMLRGDDSILDAIDIAEEVLMSVVVIGELHSGFHGGNQFKKNQKLLQEFLDDRIVKVYPITEEAAEIFGELHADLRNRGRQLPINDVWIASQCLEVGAVLLTYDEHFEQVPGLRLWAQ